MPLIFSGAPRACAQSTIAKKIMVTHRCQKFWLWRHRTTVRPPVCPPLHVRQYAKCHTQDVGNLRFSVGKWNKKWKTTREETCDLLFGSSTGFRKPLKFNWRQKIKLKDKKNWLSACTCLKVWQKVVKKLSRKCHASLKRFEIFVQRL